MSASFLAEIFGPDGIVVIVAVVVVLLFGGSRLPQLARGLGSAASEFRKGLADKGEKEGKTTESEKAEQSSEGSTDSALTPEQETPSIVVSPQAKAE